MTLIPGIHFPTNREEPGFPGCSLTLGGALVVAVSGAGRVCVGV